MLIETLASTPVLGHAAWTWAVFFAVIASLLALDLGVFHRKAHAIGVRESLALSALYIALGVAFGGWVWRLDGPDAAMTYWTAFVIEKSLSMDNVFVIAAILGALAVPRTHQHRVLFWGILGAIVLRGSVIAAGSELIARFEWVLLMFAAVLIFTGLKLLRNTDGDKDVANTWWMRFARKRLRVTPHIQGGRFLARAPLATSGRMALHATPLLLALVSVEVADVMFAVDSIPAVFAITTDPFLVYTSNIFAILGLRALFFALSATLERFAYLNYALAVLLMFIGGKVFAVELFGLEKIPASVSLGVTAAILAAGFAVSIWKTRKGAAAARADDA